MFEVVITGYDHQGRGISRINDKIAFIPNTIIDEVVKVKIIKEKKNFIEAEVIEYIKESPDRVYNICPYYKECGGCDLLHIKYEDQLKYKQDKIENIISRYTKENIKINKIVPSDNIYNYRNKVTFQSKDNTLGFYKKSSNDIIKIDYCKLIDNKLNEYLKNINDYGNKVVLRTNGIEVLDDDTYIIKNIGNYKFKVSIESFFQINDNVTYKMYEKIKEYCSSSIEDNILDLYCGTGTIGIYLSDKAKNVLGIEINKSAIHDAFENKELNNIKNIDFIASDVGKVIDKIKFNPDIVVVDPPRAGLDNKTIETLIHINPKKLVYTSCDPMTLARDLNILKEHFNIIELTPFDMFPNTYHVESVCVLERK